MTTEGEREGDKGTHTNTDRETCTQGGRQREREERERGVGRTEGKRSGDREEKWGKE